MENLTRIHDELFFEDEIDDTLSEALSFWINGVFSLILIVIGTLGNASVIVSLHCSPAQNPPRKRRQAFYFYLMTFAFWNTGLLIATVLFNCMPVLLKRYTNVQIYSNVSLLIGYLMGNCCVTANVWLAVVVTLERFLAVSLPFHSTRLTSPRRRAKLVSIILSVAAVLYNLPLLFELNLNQRYSLDDDVDYPYANTSQLAEIQNATLENRYIDFESDHEYEVRMDSYELQMSTMRGNTYYLFAYRVLANMIFVSGVPFLVVLLLTVKIVCLVRESDRRRAHFAHQRVCGTKSHTPSIDRSVASKSIASPSWRHAHVILTLIAAKFLLCYSLPVAVNILELTLDTRKYESDNSDWSRAIIILVDLGNLLVVLDGATNAFFYFSWWRSRIHWKNRFSRKKFVENISVQLGTGGEPRASFINETPLLSNRRLLFPIPRDIARRDSARRSPLTSIKHHQSDRKSFTSNL